MSVDPVQMFAGLTDAPQSDKNADVGTQVEEMFARTLLKEMRRTTPDGLFSSREMSMFMDFLDEHLAAAIAEGSHLGFGESLSGQLAGAARSAAPRADGAVPVDGARLSSGFGARRHPIRGHQHEHTGLDLAVAKGTPIHPVRDGVVTFVGRKGSYGNVVEVQHDNGLTSRYAHCDRLDVRAGQRVAPTDVLATVGSTGRSTGPHLHLEIRDAAGEAHDPQAIFGWTFQK